MKNKLFHLVLKSCLGICLFVVSVSAFGQTITGSIATEIFQNTSSTANSLVTYNITLSNGWKSGITTADVTLKKDGTTSVYSVTGQTTSYGTISSGLVPGYYKFSATISTTNDAGKVVAVSLSQEMWVGNKVLWENCFDMEQGASQYAMKRSAATTGQTYSYMQSFNTLVSGTAGWVELSKLSPNTSDSHVFWILEAMANPRSFTPTDNITYIEFYYTNSTTYGINLRYKLSGGTYTTVALTGATLADKIRFVRNASGTCEIQKNVANSSIFSLPVNITGDLKITVLGKQLNDQADQIATSYPYPSTNYPFTTAFNGTNRTNTGNVTLRIAPLSGFTAPYNYFLSDRPIADMKTAYKYFKDSINPNIDSATFFTGATSATNYTSNELPSGTYYGAAFDSKGVRIYGNTWDLSPAVTFDKSANMITSYHEFLSTAVTASGGPTTIISYASMNNYINEGQNGKIVYYLTTASSEQAFGVLPVGDLINSGTSIFSKLTYGFYVWGGALYSVINNVRSTLPILSSAKTGVPIELVFDAGTVYFKSEGAVLASSTLSDAYSYKSGLIVNGWGIRIRQTGFIVSALPFHIPVTVTDNACGKNSGDVSITYPTTGFHGGTISSLSFQLKNMTDETAVVNVGAVNATSFNDLAPGVYSLEGGFTLTNGTATSYTNVKKVIYVGSRFSWENTANLNTSYWTAGNTHYAVGTGTITTGSPAKAISSNKLNTQTAGWAVATPRIIYNPFGSTANALTAFTLSEGPQMSTLASSIDPNMPVIYFYGGMAWTASGYIGLFQLISPLPSYAVNTPTLIARNASGVVKYRQNYSVLRTVSTYTFGRWRPAMVAKVPNTGLIDCLASFQCAPTTTDIYGQLKYDLDGYYHIMKNGQIQFVFNQEYNSANLTFTIYNSMDQPVKTQADFPALATTNGMNYLAIDVTGSHCIGTGFFYLEVTNSKKEVSYLRFYNDYSGCTISGDGGGH